MTTVGARLPKIRIRSIIISALVAGVIAAIVNIAIAIAAVLLGAPQTQQLMPPVDAVTSLVACAFGAIGWAIIRGKARDPRRALQVAAPTIFVLSFLPDIGLAVTTVPQTGWGPLAALALMHIVTITTALLVFVHTMPIRQGAAPSDQVAA